MLRLLQRGLKVRIDNELSAKFGRPTKPTDVLTIDRDCFSDRWYRGLVRRQPDPVVPTIRGQKRLLLVSSKAGSFSPSPQKQSGIVSSESQAAGDDSATQSGHGREQGNGGTHGDLATSPDGKETGAVWPRGVGGSFFLNRSFVDWKKPVIDRAVSGQFRP
jgi:hypothetical protein